VNIDDILHRAFRDNEYRAPDSSEVLQTIRAELDGSPRRYAARLAPPLVAVVVIAVALIVVLTRSPTPHTARPGAESPTTTPTTAPRPTSTSALLPNSAASASAAARAILRSVPLPPGAREIHDLNAGLSGATLELSSLDAKASGVWLIPGTVAAAVDYARAHPAPGFKANCTCGGATVKWIDFYSQERRRAINYVIEPSDSDVQIGITAIVAWVPDRPAWSFVAETGASVDVTVQRVRQAGSTGGAPTVHRTLTAGAARRLATLANHLRPQAKASCRGPVILVAATDSLVFHAPGRTVTFEMSSSSCPQFTVSAGGENPTFVETGALDAALLHELGLPAHYGH
jgi:hypothetical protein